MNDDDFTRPLSAAVARQGISDPHVPTEAELTDFWAYDELSPDAAAFDRLDLWPEGSER